MNSFILSPKKSKRVLAVLVVTVVFMVVYFAVHTTKVVETKSKTEVKKVHRNSDENEELHKLYRIFAYDVWKAEITLKFGITCQLDFKRKPGNPRPEYQVKYFQNLPEYKNYIITYEIVIDNIKGRREAKRLEKEFVTKYYLQYNEMPPEQKRPIPDDLDFK